MSRRAGGAALERLMNVGTERSGTSALQGLLKPIVSVAEHCPSPFPYRLYSCPSQARLRILLDGVSLKCRMRIDCSSNRNPSPEIMATRPTHDRFTIRNAFRSIANTNCPNPSPECHSMQDLDRELPPCPAATHQPDGIPAGWLREVSRCIRCLLWAAPHSLTRRRGHVPSRDTKDKIAASTRPSSRKQH